MKRNSHFILFALLFFGLFSAKLNAKLLNSGDNFYSVKADDSSVLDTQTCQFSLPATEIICPGETKTLDGTIKNAANYNTISYTWTDSFGNVLGHDPKLVITQAGEYTITAVVNGNCTASFTDNVTLYPYKCEVPQGISPNGDGLNDNWVLDYLAEQTGIANLEIFDRRGVKVYEKKDYTHEFVGKNDKGNELPAASYFYVIKLKDGRKLTGWLYLAR